MSQVLNERSEEICPAELEQTDSFPESTYLIDARDIVAAAVVVVVWSQDEIGERHGSRHRAVTNYLSPPGYDKERSLCHYFGRHGRVKALVTCHSCSVVALGCSVSNGVTTTA